MRPATDPPAEPTGRRSGLVALIGRPNVGKSTLLNALLGRKLAIISDRPQTTRTVIRGVLHRPEGQAVLLDTPGLHKPQTLLGQRLNDLVRHTLAEVDVICFLVDAAAGVGRGDRFLADELRTIRTPVLAAVNKTDTAARVKVVQALDAAGKLGDFAEIVPISARTGDQVDLLADLLVGQLPEGPPLYPEEQDADEPEDHLIAEVVREKALALVRDELPHSIAVLVEETEQDPNGLLTIRANLYVERPSQKAIVVGKGGSVLREIGTRARTELEALLSARIYLDLHVKVAKEWQRDPKQLARLGF
jgi:GTP-binding protein Era